MYPNTSKRASGSTRLTVVAIAVCIAWTNIEAQPPAPARPTRVRAEVLETNLVEKAAPVYPREAREARIQGEVELDIVIGFDGTVEEAVALSGPAELLDSAVAAVRQWRYRPTLLNGQPVRVITTVVIHYQLQ